MLLSNQTLQPEYHKVEWVEVIMGLLGVTSNKYIPQTEWHLFVVSCCFTRECLKNIPIDFSGCSNRGWCNFVNFDVSIKKILPPTAHENIFPK